MFCAGLAVYVVYNEIKRLTICGVLVDLIICVVCVTKTSTSAPVNFVNEIHWLVFLHSHPLTCHYECEDIMMVSFCMNQVRSSVHLLTKKRREGALASSILLTTTK